MPVGDFQVDAALQLDQLSMLMTLIITGVGFLIHIFSVGYMRQDPGYPRYMAYLNLFVFFMLTLVLGANYPLMFVGWEGVGLCSYLLIGFWFNEKANADAGKKAFIVNRIGDFGFLMAMFMIFAHLGTLDFVEVFERAPQQLAFGGAVVTVITLFLFLGATGKSAQIPLYVWLPDAMAGPTPVSALIHAATMVTAGVYMIVRSATLFALAPASAMVVALVGALTAIFAATIGLKQWDIKKVLAYSTVSQLGFMVAAVGMGAYVAGVFHLMTHAFFKACLFLGSGAVIHAMHHALHATHNPADAQDMRNMGGLRRYMPVTFATMGIATLAIAGVPPFAGFFSKDEIIGAAFAGANGYSGLSDQMLLGIEGRYVMGFIWGTLSIAALMTAFYMGRLMIYTFFGPNRTGDPERAHLHEAGPTMTIPLIVLAALSVFGGFLNVVDAPIVRWFDFGQGTALHRWLHPVIEGAEGVMAVNMNMPDYVPHPAADPDRDRHRVGRAAARLVPSEAGRAARRGDRALLFRRARAGALQQVVRGRGVRPDRRTAGRGAVEGVLQCGGPRGDRRHRGRRRPARPGRRSARRPHPDGAGQHLRIRDPGRRAGRARRLRRSLTSFVKQWASSTTATGS
jgi:NADH-quinone oxidoreductase subunit L